MKLAVVGGGVSGLVCAHLLHERQAGIELTVFEAAPTPGGHAHTIDVRVGGRSYAVDTGFVVFNERTYPMFSRLLARLGIVPRPTTMSFSVRDDVRRFEYGTHAPSTLLMQPHALLDRNFHRLFRDVARFRRDLSRTRDDEALTLGEFLDRGGYEVAFCDFVIYPVSATIWSCDFEGVRRLPLAAWWRFIQNHGMLNIFDPPEWLFIEGGSRRYVERLCRPFADRIRAATPVERVCRRSDGVWVTPRGGPAERFDQVIMALHADQALALLDPPSALEAEVLGALPYRDNDVTVHTDASVLPKRRRAWSSWNYRLSTPRGTVPTVSYNMNILHQLPAPEPLLVSLNLPEVQRARVLASFRWQHPCLSHGVLAAQARHHEISGVDRIHYCGAYWGSGFHEDGVASALRVVADLGHPVSL